MEKILLYVALVVLALAFILMIAGRYLHRPSKMEELEKARHDRSILRQLLHHTTDGSSWSQRWMRFVKASKLSDYSARTPIQNDVEAETALKMAFADISNLISQYEDPSPNN